MKQKVIFLQTKGVVILALTFFIVEHGMSQARLDFLSNSNISAYTYSEVKSPVTDPPCPPPEFQDDPGINFITLQPSGRIYGGAFSKIRRGRPNCRISSQGTAVVLLDGNSSNHIRMVWWCHSIVQYDCYDPDCAWYATDTSQMDANVQMVVAGVPAGTPVEVSFFWEHFSSYANRPEAVNEDYAEIHNANLDLFGRVGFGSGMNVGGNLKFFQKRTGDSTATFTLFNGDTLNIDVAGLTTAHIQPPARTPNNQREDDASADFYGYVEIFVNAPGSPVITPTYGACANGSALFSLDIGSDVEFSDPTVDGNETLDPGDLYWANTGILTPFFNDSLLFGAEPAPSAGNPAETCFPGPLQQFQDVLNFDMDAADRIDYDLYNNMNNYGPGKPSIAPFNSECIYSPAYMMLSFDEDRGINFNSAANCNVPSMFDPYDSLMLRGALSENDEVLVSTLYNIPGTGTYYGSASPYKNEESFSPLLAPAPPTIFPPDPNDDVDALDIMEDVALCPYQYFSVDHEAHYIYGADTMIAGAIYQYMSPGVIGMVVDPAVHLGLPLDVDIDAFEFAWVYDSLQQRNGLALVFSVSAADPFAAEDYTGGLDPGILYASFLNGTYFEMAPSVKPGNVDAITFYCAPFYGYGSVFTPPTYTVGIPELDEQMLDLNIYPNPSDGDFHVSFDLPQYALVKMVMTDVNGKEVWRIKNRELSAGRQAFDISLDKVSGGIYFLKLEVIMTDGATQDFRRKVSVIR